MKRRSSLFLPISFPQLATYSYLARFFFLLFLSLFFYTPVIQRFTKRSCQKTRPKYALLAELNESWNASTQGIDVPWRRNRQRGKVSKLVTGRWGINSPNGIFVPWKRRPVKVKFPLETFGTMVSNNQCQTRWKLRHLPGQKRAANPKTKRDRSREKISRKYALSYDTRMIVHKRIDGSQIT